MYRYTDLYLITSQVCEEYRLHRETFYLAKDLLDRFLDTRLGLLKEQLQLIGVSCLFIASKIEVSVSVPQLET